MWRKRQHVESDGGSAFPPQVPRAGPEAPNLGRQGSKVPDQHPTGVKISGVQQTGAKDIGP